MANQPNLVTDGDAFVATGLVHRILRPQTSGPHPTVVMLHGRFGNEDVMWIFARAIPDHWLIVAPRAIHTHPDGGYVWHHREPDEWPTLNEFDQAVTAVTRFIQALPKQYDADLQQIYLMGFSQGAATAYATAMRQPALVKGIAGLVGFVPVKCDEALEIAPLANLPIFMAVGKEDPLIPYERAQKCAQTLRAAQAQLSYHDYETGHKLNSQGMRDLQQWWAERAQAML